MIRIIAFLIGASVKRMLAPSFLISALLLAAAGIVEEAGAWRSYALGEISQGDTARLTLILSAEHDSSEGARLDAERICGNANIENCTTDSSAMNFETTGGDPAPNPFQNACVGAAYAPLSVSVYIRMTLWDGFQRRGSITDESAFQAAMAACNAALSGNGTCDGPNPPERLCDLSGCSADTHVVDHSVPGGCREGRPSDCPRMGDAADQTLLHSNNGRARCLNESECADRFRAPRGFRCVVPESPQDCMALDAASPAPGVGPVFNPEADGAGRCIVEAACAEEFRLVENSQCVEPRIHQDCADAGRLFFVDETGFHGEIGASLCLTEVACAVQNRVARDGRCVLPASPEECMALDATSLDADIGPVFNDLGICITEAACTERFRLVKDGRCVAPENPQDCMALDGASSDEDVGPVFNPGASGAMRCIVEAACTEQLRLVKDGLCVAPETPQDCMALDATYTGTRDRFGPVFFAEGGACIAEDFCINQLLRVAKEGRCIEPETPQDCVALEAGYTGGRTNIGPVFDADGGSGERCRTDAACLSKGRAVKDGRCVAPESSEDCIQTLYAPGSSPGEGRCVIGGVCTLLHRVPKGEECVVPESAQDCMALDAVSFDPLIGPVFDADGSGAMRCLADEAACTEQFRLVQEGQCVAPASYQDCVSLDAAFGASEAGLSIGPIFYGNRSGADRCRNPVSSRECRELSLNSDQLTPIFERGACRAQAGNECPYPDQPLHVFYAPDLAPKLCHTENECWSRGYIPDASAETCRAAASHADCLQVSERGASLMHAVYHDPDHMLLCRRPQTSEECREASEMLGLMTPLLRQFPPGDIPPDQPSCMALSSDPSEADMQCAAAFGSAGAPYSAAGGRCVQGCPADDKYQAAGMAACLTAQECYDSFLVPRSDGSCAAVATNEDCRAVLANHGSPPSGLGAIYDDDEALNCRHPENSEECVIYRLTEPIHTPSEDDNCAPAESNNECRDAHPDMPLRVADGSCRAQNADDECRSASPLAPISNGAGGCAPAVDDAACRAAHSTFPISGGDGSCEPAADDAACRAAHPEFPIRGGDGSCGPPTSHADCLAADPTLPIFDGVSCIAAADDAVCRAAHTDLPISDGRGLCRAVASHADCRSVDPALPIFDGGTCRAAEDGECSLHHPSAPNALLADDGSILCLSLEECVAMTLVPDGSICDVPESSFQCSQIDITRPIFVEGASGAGRCAAAQTDQECADAFPFKPVRNADGSCRAESESDACRSADPLAPILNESGSCEAAADDEACRDAFPTFPIRGADGSCGPVEDHAACRDAHPTFPIRDVDGSCKIAEDHAACQAVYPAFPIRAADGSCNAAQFAAECADAHPDEPMEFNGMCVATAECAGSTPLALPDDPTACASESQCRMMDRVADDGVCRPPESLFECATIDVQRPVLRRSESGAAQCIAAESDAQCRTLYPDRQKLADDGSCRPITSVECRNENPTSPISILTGSGGSCAAAEDHAACRVAHPAFPIRGADGSCGPAEDHAACRVAHPAFPIRAADGLCREAADNADCEAAYPAEPLESNGTCVAAATCADSTPLGLPDDPSACVSEAECMAMTRLASAAGICVQPESSQECMRIDRNRPILDAAASGAARCVAAASDADCMNNYPNAPRFVADGSCRPLTNEECRDADAAAPISSGSECLPAVDSEACFDAYPTLPIRDSDGSCREAASDIECMNAHPDRPFESDGTCVEVICAEPTPLLLQGEETCVSEAQCEQMGRLSGLGACRTIANDQDCAMLDEQRPVFDESNSSCRPLTNEECLEADSTAPISAGGGCIPAADSDACLAAHPRRPIRADDGSCNPAANSMECMDAFGDRLPIRQRGSTCVPRSQADCSPRILGDDGTCRDAENADDCRAAELSETAVHGGMCVAFSHEFCRSTGQVAELQADGTINCRNPSNVQECMDYLNLGAIDNGVCGSAGREYCAAQRMFFAGDSCVDNCPAGEIGIDGACAQAAAEGALLYETMQCEEAGWESREESQIAAQMTLLAAFCNIPARITMASLESSAQAAGEVRDGALNSCVLWHNTGYIAADPLCGNERLFGEEGLPRRPAGFEAREGHRLTVLLATATGEGQAQITFNNAAVGRLSSSPPSGGDASSSGGESGGGAIFALVPLALAAYYWAVSDDSSLIPEFGYRQENGEDIWKYGGRIEYRGEGWRSYVAADAEGESGRMTYKSGGRYEGGFWSASYSSRETGLAGDYDFALSAEWDAGVWRMTPGWRMKFSHEAGDLWESSGMLSMDALWNANKWTARTQAGFAWNFDAGGFAPRLQMNVRREF